MNFSDLQEGLRNQGYFNLDEILYAIIQTNGTLSIMPRSQYSPLTANDMKINKEKSALPIIIVAEGKKMEENLKLAKIDNNQLNEILNLSGYKKIEDSFTEKFLNEDNTMKTGKVGETVINGYKKIEGAFVDTFLEKVEKTTKE